MERMTDLIQPQELKLNWLKKMASKHPPVLYAVYDDLMDEFFIKMLQPSTLVSSYYITDSFALLVEPSTGEVVGYHLSNFSGQFLELFPTLSSNWEVEKKRFSTYQTLTPVRVEDAGLESNNLFLFDPHFLDEILVPA
jgi:hypothetical protein